ncbi:MAG: enoyl-CoA hydratase/isomerase family protein [Gammaproteobacteria bacterium]
MKLGQSVGFAASLHAPGILELRFNRPERMNASTAAMKRELMDTLLQAQMDEAVRVVLFTAEGRAFMAGDDLRNYRNDPDAAQGALPELANRHYDPISSYEGLRNVSQGLNAAVMNLDKLSIAAINGHCIQTGLSLALSCDFRIAAADARLGSATLRFGYMPDEGGHFLVTRLIGVARAMDFFMRKRVLGAAEALDLGLVHQVVEPAALRDAAFALAAELAEGPQVAMRLLKRAIYAVPDQSFAQAGDDIATKTAISDHHPDAHEGKAAFLEKRQPRFNAGGKAH